MAVAADFLSKLNPQQRQAATFTHTRPLLVIAGAGTGKTNTLAHRVAHLIATGIHPARILLLTFTRRAAAEMLRRVESILQTAELGGEATASRVWGGTFPLARQPPPPHACASHRPRRGVHRH